MSATIIRVNPALSETLNVLSIIGKNERGESVKGDAVRVQNLQATTLVLDTEIREDFTNNTTVDVVPLTEGNPYTGTLQLEYHRLTLEMVLKKAAGESNPLEFEFRSHDIPNLGTLNDSIKQYINVRFGIVVEKVEVTAVKSGNDIDVTIRALADSLLYLGTAQFKLKNVDPQPRDLSTYVVDRSAFGY